MTSRVGAIRRLSAGSAIIVVFTLMTAGSIEGGGHVADPARHGEPASHPGGTQPATIRPGPGRRPVVLAEVVDSDPSIVAEGQRFSPDAVVVPARRRITLTFENRDVASSHGLRIQLPGRDPAALTVRPAKVMLRFRSPAPGPYRIVCDIHRGMQATLNVVP